MSEVERVNGFKQWLKPQFFISLILVIVILAAALAVLLVQRNPVVATVNGEKITRNELYEAMYATMEGKTALDDLVTGILVLQEGKRVGVHVSDEEIDLEIQKIVDEEFGGSQDTFDMVLEQYGLTMESLRRNILINTTLQYIVKQDLEITDTEAEEYFAENREYFDIPDQIEARHILVETEEEAREIIDLLENGEDFAELAKSRSQDPGSKDDGGNLGYFSLGQNFAEFDEAAFALEVGERSEPVETYAGFHVIEVLDRKDGRAVTFAEVEEQVREKIIEDKSPDLIRALIERLHAEAEISYK